MFKELPLFINLWAFLWLVLTPINLLVICSNTMYIFICITCIYISVPGHSIQHIHPYLWMSYFGYMSFVIVCGSNDICPFGSTMISTFPIDAGSGTPFLVMNLSALSL